MLQFVALFISSWILDIILISNIIGNIWKENISLIITGISIIIPVAGLSVEIVSLNIPIISLFIGGRFLHGKIPGIISGGVFKFVTALP